MVFFDLNLMPANNLHAGMLLVEVELVDVTETTENVVAKGKGTVLIPQSNQYAFISDIDDTFFISHSSNFVNGCMYY